MHPVARLWCETFKKESLSGVLGGRRRVKRLLKLSRAWRRILRQTRMITGSPVLEAGCGWGAQLIPLAHHGFRVTGIDCSRAALQEGKIVAGTVGERYDIPGKILLVTGDFMAIALRRKYALVFQRGVLEHYLDEKDRLDFLTRMFTYTTGDGYVVSIVPSGIHPLRARFKKENIGGYNIPEMDYSPARLREEAIRCGGSEVRVLCHNIMGYLNDIPASVFVHVLFRAVYLFFQLIPRFCLPGSFQERHAYSLICIAKKR